MQQSAWRSRFYHQCPSTNPMAPATRASQPSDRQKSQVWRVICPSRPLNKFHKVDLDQSPESQPTGSPASGVARAVRLPGRAASAGSCRQGTRAQALGISQAWLQAPSWLVAPSLMLDGSADRRFTSAARRKRPRRGERQSRQPWGVYLRLGEWGRAGGAESTLKGV